MGLATAREFVAHHAKVTIASRSKEKIDAALAILGGKAKGLRLDLRDNEAVERFAASAGEFDHVVISAAETSMGRVDTLPLTDAYAAMDSKFWGAYHLARSISIRSTGSLTIVSGYLSIRPGKAAALKAPSMRPWRHWSAASRSSPGQRGLPRPLADTPCGTPCPKRTGTPCTRPPSSGSRRAVSGRPRI